MVIVASSTVLSVIVVRHASAGGWIAGSLDDASGQEPLSPAVRQAVQDPAPLAHAAQSYLGLTAIVVLMVCQSGAWSSVAVLAVAWAAARFMHAWLARQHGWTRAAVR